MLAENNGPLGEIDRFLHSVWEQLPDLSQDRAFQRGLQHRSIFGIERGGYAGRRLLHGGQQHCRENQMTTTKQVHLFLIPSVRPSTHSLLRRAGALTRCNHDLLALDDTTGEVDGACSIREP
jgi:hypothetical protein